MRIPINTEGSIKNSDHNAHRIVVKDDSHNTGGFLVFEWWENSTGPNANGAFDSWVENTASLKQFFADSAWVVEWES